MATKREGEVVDRKPRHRLVAILAADGVEYSRLMAGDDSGTLDALDAARAVFAAGIAEFQGRVVDMAGDSILAIFGTVSGAVKAALAVQRKLLAEAAGQPKERILKFRIGVHLGDVIEKDDGSVYGSGVNVAARVQALAEPGAIAVSGTLRGALAQSWPDLEFDDRGTHEVRNIAHPVHVFGLSIDEADGSQASAGQEQQTLVPSQSGKAGNPELDKIVPSPRPLAAGLNNLPLQASSLVGRERELRDISTALIGTRLLTLVGTGGLGKTRLALQAAADALHDFPDGVWFSDLAGLADARLVPQTVAMTLGVDQRAKDEGVSALLNHARERKLLIVLDNCEHLLQACADLARVLLQSTKSLKILATSRESLRIGGEMTYSVPPLAVPGVAGADGAATARYGAVRLFVDRAIAAHSAFEFTDQQAPAVAEICRHLDGIPLAIELAAARVRSLSVDKIAERLIDRLRLLTVGDRTAAPRHRTLRASIDWSHELLSDHERALLRRLSLFVGGWTLEAAEDICASGSIERSMVLDLLTALVEKSLVQFDSDAGRYRMLETVREYAQERLDESRDDDRLHTRYLRHFVEFAERACSELRGPNQATWLAKLDRERENLVSAHAASDRAEGGAEFDLRLVNPITRYCVVRGVPQLGYRIAVEALIRGEAENRSRAHCDALFAGGQIAAHLGRYPEARSYLEQSLAMAREIDDSSRVVASLTLLGSVSLGQGDLAAAQVRLEEAVADARNKNIQRQISSALSTLAELHHTRRELDTAERLYLEALAHFRTQGDADSIAVTLCNLAMVWIESDDTHRAQSGALEALDIVEAIGSKHTGHTVLEVLTGLAASRASWEAAAMFFGAAARLAEESGLEPSPPDMAFLDSMVPRVYAAIGAPTFAVAEQAGRALGYEEAIALSRSWLVSEAPARE